MSEDILIGLNESDKVPDFKAGLDAGREEAREDLEVLAKAVLANEHLSAVLEFRDYGMAEIAYKEWAEAFAAALPVARKVMKEKP